MGSTASRPQGHRVRIKNFLLSRGLKVGQVIRVYDPHETIGTAADMCEHGATLVLWVSTDQEPKQTVIWASEKGAERSQTFEGWG